MFLLPAIVAHTHLPRSSDPVFVMWAPSLSYISMYTPPGLYLLLCVIAVLLEVIILDFGHCCFTCFFQFSNSSLLFQFTFVSGSPTTSVFQSAISCNATKLSVSCSFESPFGFCKYILIVPCSFSVVMWSPDPRSS